MSTKVPKEPVAITREELSSSASVLGIHPTISVLKDL